MWQKGGKLGSFNGLALLLLHQAHAKDSAFRDYICSLPLHIPLPFFWSDADLPSDFVEDKAIVAHRLVVR